MPTMQQNADGSWTKAVPHPGTRLGRVEQRLRNRGHKRLAALLAWWDELWLG